MNTRENFKNKIKIENKARFYFAVAIAVAVLVILIGLLYYCIWALYFSNSKNGVNSSNSQDSYAPNAWKYAELVHSDVLYPVVRDVDGDTIVALVAGHDITVRLIGADTPETVDPRKPVQCYGPEASTEAKRLFGTREGMASTTGISVYLDKDPQKGDYDKYGRLLAYIRLPQNIISADGVDSGTDIYNEYMIEQGFAHEYTYFNEPYKYQAQFKSDEKVAKKAKIGLWGNCPAS